MADRPALTAALITEAAASVADAGGLGQVSMRNVAKALGVEAMSLYHHIEGKDALVDALVDWVFAQIELPAPGQPWRAAMAERATSARAVLAAHPWALGLIESRRTPSPALLRHHDGVLGALRGGGFSVLLAAHAFSALDAYVYGFVLTETNLPMAPDESAEDFVDEISAALPAEDYPHLVELIRERVIGRDYSYGDEFAFGLDLLLDGLERQLAAET